MEPTKCNTFHLNGNDLLHRVTYGGNQESLHAFLSSNTNYFNGGAGQARNYFYNVFGKTRAQKLDSGLHQKYKVCVLHLFSGGEYLNRKINLNQGAERMAFGVPSQQSDLKAVSDGSCPSYPGGTSSSSTGVRTLLIGTGKLASRAARALKESPTKKVIVGTLDSDPQPELAREFADVPWLGGLERLSDVVVTYLIDEVHVALPLNSCFEEFETLRASVKDLGLPISFHVSLFDGLSDPSLRAESDFVVMTFNRTPYAQPLARIAKRTLDLVASLICVIVFSPVFVVIATAIKLTSRGHVFFRQWRVGRGRRIFPMLKFRTMVEDAEELRKDLQHVNDARGISFKLFRDPRVTRVGAFLRRSSLDELPQLFNVIRGDMSLVGPRPIPVWVAEQLREPTYLRRFSVLPGLTGLWQVRGREQDFDVMASQDLQYIDSWSLGLDLKILAATIPAVLGGKGAH
jgi:exopolysaccharide biosynthesis polyprenyl glycosylphosphotransferase